MPTYSTDQNNTLPNSNVNLTDRLIDKDVVVSATVAENSPSSVLNAQGALTAPVYPSSALTGSDTRNNPTDTQADFALACNILLAEIGQLSLLMPGIYQSMTTGVPSSASGQPTNISTTESAFIEQMSSLKFNDARRHIDRLLPYLKRFRDNIGAMNVSGNQAPTTPRRYPSDVNPLF